MNENTSLGKEMTLIKTTLCRVSSEWPCWLLCQPIQAVTSLTQTQNSYEIIIFDYLRCSYFHTPSSTPSGGVRISSTFVKSFLMPCWIYCKISETAFLCQAGDWSFLVTLALSSDVEIRQSESEGFDWQKFIPTDGMSNSFLYILLQIFLFSLKMTGKPSKFFNISDSIIMALH